MAKGRGPENPPAKTNDSRDDDVHLSGEPGNQDTSAPEVAELADDNTSSPKGLVLPRHEGAFAVDRLLFRYRPSLHAEHTWEVTSGGLVASHRPDFPRDALRDVPNLTLAALTQTLDPFAQDAEPGLLATAAAVASQIEENIAARVLRVLYRIANDPPYYRQPLIEVDMNALLDDLGYERAKDGYHDPKNRARVRDVLLALARVELRGQVYDPVTRIRDLYVAPLIALRGGRYRHEETRDIGVQDLMEKGLPLSLRIELGWYTGVRRPDGQRGNNFALLPRDLAFYQGLPPADQLGSADRFAEFLWLRYSRQQGASTAIIVTLSEALAKAGIHVKNTTRARELLAQAIRHLAERGFIERLPELPRTRNGSFVITLRPSVSSAGEQAHGSLAQESMGDSLERPTSTLNDGGDGLESEADQTSNPSLVASDEEPLLVLHDVVIIDGAPRTATQVWRLIYDASQQQLSRAVMTHLSSVRPSWRIERSHDGTDTHIALYLGVQAALLTRLQGERDALQTIADGFSWRGAFQIEFGRRISPS